MKTQACFVNSETPPTKTTHICWFITEQSIDGLIHLHLNEVVQEEFPHPDAPEHAVVFQQKCYQVKTVPINKAAELLMLKAAMETVDKLHR